jgi:hypothetical protein
MDIEVQPETFHPKSASKWNASDQNAGNDEL